MKRILCVLLVLVSGSFAQRPDHANAVPDEATAVRIAENALSRIYWQDSDRIRETIHSNTIKRRLARRRISQLQDQHASAKSVPCVGGAAMADIKQSSGRILKTGHSE